MTDVKQVKVDNWGIYFLQRLKHFFNRTDYCDLTLQFQDNAQLKVHRLVLNACTEYFEILERTCEMYEDCLVMPDDLQADVVVPIVNFMYTGQLEFRMDLLEKLYQTSLIMNMPVLTKLLEAHRCPTPKPTHFYTAKHKNMNEPTPSTSNKRSYSKAFETKSTSREKKVYQPTNKLKEIAYDPLPMLPKEPRISHKKNKIVDPKPTRYELPEELDTDNVFDNSFTSISYDSKPLMIHPETVKHYSRKSHLFGESSKKYSTPTLDIVECKKSNNDEIMFDTLNENPIDDTGMFQTYPSKSKQVDSNQLFDQMLDQTEGTKITIDTKSSKVPANLDHAKIISEVLKKYSHLLKGSKNIKLKILNTPNKTKKTVPRDEKLSKVKNESADTGYTYETDVLDSKQAAKLIAMGAENINGPWICLICGTPGKALHFTTYFKFRRHLVDVHNEKPVANICEYCGHRALKRNYLLHHLYSKHGVDPPAPYHFPKCCFCNYVALSSSLLAKHKMTHTDIGFRCNVCASQFSTSNQLLQHIQKTGHKYCADRKNNLQCVYCLKVFLRENNLWAHLKTYHKNDAKADGIIEDSDDEKPKEGTPKVKSDCKYEVKYELPINNENEYEEVNLQYQIQPDGNIHVVTNNKPKVTPPSKKHKILNDGFCSIKPVETTKNNKIKDKRNNSEVIANYNQDVTSVTNSHEELVLIDNKEYIFKENQLIPRRRKVKNEYCIPKILSETNEETPQTSTAQSHLEYSNILDTVDESSITLDKPRNLNQPIEFVVSNEDEYKALMSANHPIIFDNGDSNKTLTMLEPHSSSLDTTSIQLDNNQSDDMMIIQNDYPLNVTENVPADDSNIVVVYSRPVDTTNKEFQILTTEGLDTQFVQSTEILTQNYETITTSTAMMNTDIIGTQDWPTEVGSDTASLETKQCNTESDVQQNSIEVNSHIHDLPEIQLLPSIQNSVETKLANSVDSVLSEIHNSVSDELLIPPHNDKMEEDKQTNEVDNSKNADGLLEDTEKQGQTIVIPETSNNLTDISEKGEKEIDYENQNSQAEVTNREIESTENTNVVNIVDSITKSTPEVMSEINENIETTNVSDVTKMDIDENAVNEETKIVNQSEINVDDPTEKVNVPSPTFTQEFDNNIDNHLEENNCLEQPEKTTVSSEDTLQKTVDVNEKMQSLVSEWTEDEYDSQDAPETDVPIESNIVNKTTDSVLSPSEVEESIENIQKEVEKQMSTPSTIDELGKNEVSSQNILKDLVQTSEPEISKNKDSSISNQKISSLLSDWQDNDSQEDLPNDTEVNEANKTHEDEDLSKTNNVSENCDSKNDEINKPEDKIKSLVSDWDDDEDESKIE